MVVGLDRVKPVLQKVTNLSRAAPAEGFTPSKVRARERKQRCVASRNKADSWSELMADY